jgi:hypothetical protein
VADVQVAAGFGWEAADYAVAGVFEGEVEVCAFVFLLFAVYFGSFGWFLWEGGR